MQRHPGTLDHAELHGIGRARAGERERSQACDDYWAADEPDDGSGQWNSHFPFVPFEVH
jgi:hypothetical protein